VEAIMMIVGVDGWEETRKRRVKWVDSLVLNARVKRPTRMD